VCITTRAIGNVVVRDVDDWKDVVPVSWTIAGVVAAIVTGVVFGTVSVGKGVTVVICTMDVFVVRFVGVAAGRTIW